MLKTIAKFYEAHVAIVFAIANFLSPAVASWSAAHVGTLATIATALLAWAKAKASPLAPKAGS